MGFFFLLLLKQGFHLLSFFGKRLIELVHQHVTTIVQSDTITHPIARSSVFRSFPSHVQVVISFICEDGLLPNVCQGPLPCELGLLGVQPPWLVHKFKKWKKNQTESKPFKNKVEEMIWKDQKLQQKKIKKDQKERNIKPKQRTNHKIQTSMLCCNHQENTRKLSMAMNECRFNGPNPWKPTLLSIF